VKFFFEYFSLVEALIRNPGEDIACARVENGPGGDCVVEVFLGVVGLGETVQRIGELRIESQCRSVSGDGFRDFPFAEKINPRVEVIFCFQGNYQSAIPAPPNRQPSPRTSVPSRARWDPCET